jgi:F-type H+-transporting ATPase subunit delta
MSGNRAAIRYAKAVLQQAKEVNLADVVFSDMQCVFNTIKASKELQNMLKSPLIKGNDKKEALLEIFKDNSEETKSLIRVLVDNKRTNLLTDVSKNYIELHNDEKGVKIAQVTTAVPLSDELEQKVLTKIKELTGSNKVTLENNIDESILGGFILRIGDLQYNASIANNLSNIKREFSKSI